MTEQELQARVVPELQAVLQRVEGAALAPEQKLVYALTVGALGEYYTLGGSWAKTPLKNAGILSGCGLLLCLLLYGLFWLVARVFHLDYLVFILCALLVLILWGAARTLGAEVYIRKDSKGRLEYMNLGRISSIISSGAFLVALAFLVFTLLCQIGLIQFTSTHAGLREEASFVDALAIAGKTALHIPADLLSLFQVRLGPDLDNYPTWPALVLVLFRVVYDCLFGVIGFCLFQRLRIRKFFRDFPRAPSADAFLTWVDRLAQDKANWGRRLYDEVIFLLLAADYVRGRFDLVRHLGGQLPAIAVTDDVRRLFVDPQTGKPLLPLATDQRSDGSSPKRT